MELKEQDEMLSELRNQILRSQHYMKKQYDKHHRPLCFQVGDLVWLRLHPRMPHGSRSPHSLISFQLWHLRSSAF